jgi:hypothetical protein
VRREGVDKRLRRRARKVVPYTVSDRAPKRGTGRQPNGKREWHCGGALALGAKTSANGAKDHIGDGCGDDGSVGNGEALWVNWNCIATQENKSRKLTNVIKKRDGREK